jgi:hypothetical protein
MNARALQAPEPPVSVIESLTTGFETVTSKLVLILLPLGLDMLLWLGPHLSVRPIVEYFLEKWARLAALEPSLSQSEAFWRTALAPVAQHYNLLSLLSVPVVPKLVGCMPGAWCLPSLMASRAPVAVPGGQPAFINIGNVFELLTLSVTFYLVGLFLGACYLGAIALVVRDSKLSLGLLFHHIFRWWARLVAFAALIGLALVVFIAPVGLAALLAGQVAGSIAMGLVFLSGVSLGMWGLFYMAFVVQGMFLQERGLFGAIRDSARVVQWNLPGTLGLVILTAGLGFGLSVIWSIPAQDSWFALVGIAGHAYVVTGLAAATFVFYKDRYRWSAEVREYLTARAEAERHKKRLSH